MYVPHFTQWQSNRGLLVMLQIYVVYRADELGNDPVCNVYIFRQNAYLHEKPNYKNTYYVF